MTVSRTSTDALSAVAPVPFEHLPTDASAVLADLAFAGRYIPAGPGPHPIAGDFYDVLQVAPDLIAIVVADVSGHGEAAVHRMRQLRAATRAYSLESQGPISVIERLDRFVDRLETDGLATIWYGEYEPSSGRLVYASAGHPPPILHVHGDPTRRLADATAPPLGTGVARPMAVEHSEVLPVGAILVAYSDGLVERHDADIDAQIAGLGHIVKQACDPARAGSAEAIASEVLTALVPEPDQADDDVCLLVVRREPDQLLS